MHCETFNYKIKRYCLSQLVVTEFQVSDRILFVGDLKNEKLQERLPDEFYAFLPKCLSIIWIQRVSSDPFATDVERHVVRNNVADVAVLAISATDLVSGRNNCRPHRSCSPLWNGLQLIRLFTCGSTLLVCLVQHLLKETLVHVATQFSPYAPGCTAAARTPLSRCRLSNATWRSH